MKNTLGVDVHYAEKTLDRISRDVRGTPNNEIARGLLRLASTVDSTALQKPSNPVDVSEPKTLIFNILRVIDNVTAQALATELVAMANALDPSVIGESEFGGIVVTGAPKPFSQDMVISAEGAVALNRLLATIDANHDPETNPDWIDSVCTAREALPAHLFASA